MVRYIVIHNKHEGCYDYQYYEDEMQKIRLTSITINPPKVWLFDTRDEAQDFFEEYINDIDTIDARCKRGDDVIHIEHCTCGVIELDRHDCPILFYNKRNQIFLLEDGPQMFMPNNDLKCDIKNMNVTNHIFRKCKMMSAEQRRQYIELGKYCQECNDEAESKQREEPPICNRKGKDMGEYEAIELETTPSHISGDNGYSFFLEHKAKQQQQQQQNQQQDSTAAAAAQEEPVASSAPEKGGRKTTKTKIIKQR